MKPYIYLLGAVVCEVIGTMLLPLSKNFSKLIPSIALLVAYILAFYLLTFALKEIPIAIVYSTWAGLGVMLISILGKFLYGQVLQWQTVVGLILIVIGVILVNTYAVTDQHHYIITKTKRKTPFCRRFLTIKLWRERDLNPRYCLTQYTHLAYMQSTLCKTCYSLTIIPF